jgi:hypothetical protein
VLINRGNGTLEPRRDYPIGGPTGGPLAIADVNGDGTPDVTSANLQPGRVSVLLNRGAGRLQAKLEYRTGEFTNGLVTAELNGDGKPDVVTSSYYQSAVSVLLNTPGLCNVQRVGGLALTAAKQKLARVNCRAGKVRRAYSKRVKKGRVISQKPRFGALRRGSSRVSLVVSRGERR